MELAFRPGDLLSPNGSFRIGTPDELACPSDDDFFQQVKNTDTTFFNGLPAGCQKVGVQVANTSRGEVGAVITSEQIDLVVQIENVVVDGCRCQENELFTPAIASTATISSKDIFELEIALGASITEIVGFVNENHIHVSHLTNVEIINSEALLG